LCKKHYFVNNKLQGVNTLTTDAATAVTTTTNALLFQLQNYSKGFDKIPFCNLQYSSQVRISQTPMYIIKGNYFIRPL